jgi:hypothetical protein
MDLGGSVALLVAGEAEQDEIAQRVVVLLTVKVV